MGGRDLNTAERRQLASCRNRRGEEVPAIPLPLYGIRKRCGECGASFWTERGYGGHYVLVHVLALAEPRTPSPDPQETN